MVLTFTLLALVIFLSAFFVYYIKKFKKTYNIEKTKGFVLKKSKVFIKGKPAGADLATSGIQILIYKVKNDTV